MSEAEWKEIVGLLEDRDAFRRRLLETCGQVGRQGFVTQAKEALDRLKDFLKLQATPAQAIKVFLTVMEVGDELADTEDKDVVGGVISITNELRICWLVQQALAKLDNPTDRTQLIEESLKQQVALRTAAELVKVLGYEHGMYSSSDDVRPSPEPPLIPKEKVEELAKLVVLKVEVAASDGSLAAHPSFMGVVWHWRLFGGGEKAAEWVGRHVASDESFVKFVRQMSGEIRSQSFSDRVATATPHVDCEYLGQFVPVLEARRRCSDLLSVGPDWLTPEDRKLLQVVVASIGEDGSVHDPRRERRPRRKKQDEDHAHSTGIIEETEQGEADAEA
jgi:hypothetical protein